MKVSRVSFIAEFENGGHFGVVAFAAKVLVHF